MTGVLQLLALVVIACVATFLLERGGRVGYGWVTGSEFLIAGLLVGPLGLDLVSADLLHDAQVLVMLATSWLGLRFGLRLRRSSLQGFPLRSLVSSQLEPLLSFLALRALLEQTQATFGFPGSSFRASLLAAVGAATTKSALVWARGRHGARGPLSDALGAITELNDLPGVLLAGVLFGWVRPPMSRLPPKLWAPLVASLALALLLALLIRLITGRRRFRPDVAWLALFGACAVAAGAAGPLGLMPLVVCCLTGAILGWISPQADAFEETTRATERPAVQVLLVLCGASLHATPAVLAAGVAFAALRLTAKLAGGAVVGVLARPSGGVELSLGAGLLAGGGVAFALAFSASLLLPEDVAEVLMCCAAAMVVLGDMVGSPALKQLLRRRGELPLPSAAGLGAPEVQP